MIRDSIQSLEMRITTNIGAIEARLNTMETKINHNTDNINKIIKYQDSFHDRLESMEQI